MLIVVVVVLAPVALELGHRLSSDKFPSGQGNAETAWEYGNSSRIQSQNDRRDKAQQA